MAGILKDNIDDVIKTIVRAKTNSNYFANVDMFVICLWNTQGEVDRVATRESFAAFSQDLSNIQLRFEYASCAYYLCNPKHTEYKYNALSSPIWAVDIVPYTIYESSCDMTKQIFDQEIDVAHCTFQYLEIAFSLICQ